MNDIGKNNSWKITLKSTKNVQSTKSTKKLRSFKEFIDELDDLMDLSEKTIEGDGMALITAYGTDGLEILWKYSSL